jgi:transposase InsO family protein
MLFTISDEVNSMVWKALSIMNQREEFVVLASVSGANVAQLCERFGISRTTGYKWLNRYAQEGAAGLRNRSRRPKKSPGQTSTKVEKEVLALRKRRPAWGGRKLRKGLKVLKKVTPKQLPAPSTITEILRRNGLIDPVVSRKHRPFKRFERPAPNELWQMDFKGHFAVTRGGRCHPLTILDDHSRFNLALRACFNEQSVTVQSELTDVFRRYGMPHEMLMDNGPPWGDPGVLSYTGLTVWLLRLGIGVTHCHPHHPQTQGKAERFHRTLKVELLCRMSALDVPSCQPHFDRFRDEYNCERPHEALDLETPASRYHVSPCAFPEVLPAVEYGTDLAVRKVGLKGWVSYNGRQFNVGQAFERMHVGLRSAPEEPENHVEVRFCRHRIGYIDLNDSENRRMIRHKPDSLVTNKGS